MTTTDNVQATLEEALTWLADIDRQSWAGLGCLSAGSPTRQDGPG